MICKFVIEITKEDIDALMLIVRTLNQWRKEERVKFLAALEDARGMIDGDEIDKIEDLIVFLEQKGLHFPVYFEAIENLEEMTEE